MDLSKRGFVGWLVEGWIAIDKACKRRDYTQKWAAGVPYLRQSNTTRTRQPALTVRARRLERKLPPD